MGMGNQQRPPQPMGPAGGYMGARPVGPAVGGGMLSQMQPSRMPQNPMPVIRRPMDSMPQPMPANAALAAAMLGRRPIY